MSTMTLSATAVNRSAANPWVVAGIVVLPTFMEILDTTVANVALRYMAGGLSCAHPIINFRVLGERNFAMGCVIMFLAFAVIYCASMALPSLLQALFGYDALVSGLAMSPSGVSSMAAMVVVGILLGRQFDARWMIAIGLVFMAAGNYWMTRMNLQVSFWHVIGPRMVLTLGLGMIFAPASVAAYKYIPVHLRGAAVGLFSLLRTEGAASAPR